MREKSDFVTFLLVSIPMGECESRMRRGIGGEERTEE
jgi:hypothetical protein